MRKVPLAVAALTAIAVIAASWQPAAAQQCPKGKTWDYGSQSCK